MKNPRYPDVVRARIDFTKEIIDAASSKAIDCNQTLSQWVMDAILDRIEDES
jgi:hypothetical protein